jgi:DNA-binding protein H-NS
MKPSKRKGVEPPKLAGTSAKRFDLETMSLNDLWTLHGQISNILAERIRAEKNELERRLAVLDRGIEGELNEDRPTSHDDPRQKRKYPQVLPKYRDPMTSETWSGRGKLPRWLVAAMKSGRKIDEFRIPDGGNLQVLT